MTDAFAEGWDACQRALPGTETRNPYRAELAQIELLGAKRSSRLVANMERDAELWDKGWEEAAEDV